jgi:ankyrin repeat protein
VFANSKPTNAYAMFIRITHSNMVSILYFSDTEGRTPLHWAVDRGHLSAVEVLAKANADLNAKVSWNYCILIACYYSWQISSI